MQLDMVGRLGETYNVADTMKNRLRTVLSISPYQFPEKLIPLIINNALHGKKLPVYGDGKNVRDWLYVDDHAKAIDMVQENGRLGETYNVEGIKNRILKLSIHYRYMLEMLPADDPRRTCEQGSDHLRGGSKRS